MKRLTVPGWLLLLAAIAAALAILVLGIVVLTGGGEAAAIALAAVPAALAVVALIWPFRWFRKPAAETELTLPATTDVRGKEETLEQLLKITREQGVSAQERTKAYSDRAGVLLGFAGVILALIGTEAKDVFEGAASLGTVGRPLGTWFLAAAALMSTVAAFDALAVLLRRPAMRIATSQLFEFLEPSCLARSRASLLYGQLRSAVSEVRVDREANDRIRNWFNAGLISLLAALLFLLLHLGVYLQRTVETPCERAAKGNHVSARYLEVDEGEGEEGEADEGHCFQNEEYIEFSPG